MKLKSKISQKNYSQINLKTDQKFLKKTWNYFERNAILAFDDKLACYCKSGWIRDHKNSKCVRDPNWCETESDCPKEKICCRTFPCDSGLQQNCADSIASCTHQLGCGGYGIVLK